MFFNWAIFSLFSSFQQLTVNMIIIKFRWWLHSNRGIGSDRYTNWGTTLGSNHSAIIFSSSLAIERRRYIKIWIYLSIFVCKYTYHGFNLNRLIIFIVCQAMFLNQVSSAYYVTYLFGLFSFYPNETVA